MKPKGHISADITSTLFKKKKGKNDKNEEQEDLDSTTDDPTQPDTEITYTKKHSIGDPVKKKQDQTKDHKAR
ncbi:MAG: hypothetical protein V4677_10415 [Bacteroidota bacterium]